MGAICGYIDTKRGINRELLIQMNNTATYRGPDDEGYAIITPDGIEPFRGKDTSPQIALPYIKETNRIDRAAIGMASRRLSITDISARGHQPLIAHEMPIAVTFNGEIYNYKDLKEELTASGYTFYSDCDTEVLLNSYIEWGENCLCHFNGVWAFAIWDGRFNKLFCARDRLGVKPFYYYARPDHFVFASTIKQICRDDDVVRQFNLPHLATDLIYHLDNYDESTLVEGVQTLRPGHQMVISLADGLAKIKKIQVSRYWKLNVEPDTELEATEWKKRIAEIFSQSCKLCMQDEVPMAALLSGGLDSSCMVTELSALLGASGNLTTYTTSYPNDKSCDEWYYADLVNKRCGCSGHKIIPDPTAAGKGIERNFEDITYFLEGTGGLSMLGPKILLDRIRDDGIKVVLNGQGGDETMFGYVRYYCFYFSELVRKNHLIQLAKDFQQASKHSGESGRRLLELTAYFNLPTLRRWWNINRSRDILSKDVLHALQNEKLRMKLFPKNTAEMMQTEITDLQLPSLMHYDDALYSSASLESRMPFLDYRFIELAARIPTCEKFKNGYSKSIMREIYESKIPAEITWRTNKMGFSAPAKQWAASFSKEYLFDRIENANASEYFDITGLKNLFMTTPTDERIFDFLRIENFSRMFHIS